MLLKFGVSLLVTSLPLAAIAATPGARPGDDKMTCAMIGQELQPGAMAMANNTAGERGRISQATGKRAKEGQADLARRTAIATACLAGNIATMGAGDAACSAANAAEDATDAARAPRRAAEDRAMMGDIGAMMAKFQGGMAGMDQARMQRLMALAEAKNCSEPG